MKTLEEVKELQKIKEERGFRIKKQKQAIFLEFRKKFVPVVQEALDFINKGIFEEIVIDTGVAIPNTEENYALSITKKDIVVHVPNHSFYYFYYSMRTDKDGENAEDMVLKELNRCILPKTKSGVYFYMEWLIQFEVFKSAFKKIKSDIHGGSITEESRNVRNQRKGKTEDNIKEKLIQKSEKKYIKKVIIVDDDSGIVIFHPLDEDGCMNDDYSYYMPVVLGLEFDGEIVCETMNDALRCLAELRDEWFASCPWPEESPFD